MKHDVLVIGAGSAGSVIAARLSEDPRLHVLLLEAGRDFPDLDRVPAELSQGALARRVPEYLWGFVSRATEAQQLTPQPCGKVLGGTGTINGKFHVHGVPEDFARWAELGCDRWGFNAVLPAYRAIERDLDARDELRGDTGPLAFRRYRRDEWLPLQEAFYAACRDAGWADCPDMNEPGSTGIGPFPVSPQDGLRASTAGTYLAPARARANLEVRGQTRARRLRFARDGRVTGVEVRTPAGTETIEADEFLVCGGAIGTPHLLQQSGLGPADLLRAVGLPVVRDLPGVGRDLRDHQVVEMWWDTPSRFPAPPAASPTTQLALRYTAAGSAFPNDMKITARSVTKAAADSSPPPLPVRVALVPDLEFARGSGRVRPASADPEGRPGIELRFLSEEVDRRRLREGVLLALDLAKRPALREVLQTRVSPTDRDLASDAAIDDWIRRTVRTSHHLCGTCRMGPSSDPLAVTDQRGRVHGIPNLRLADASIFPDLVRANTNTTVVMAAERIAQFMLSDLRAG